MIQMQELCFTLFYKSDVTENEDKKLMSPQKWRMVPFFLKLDVKSSFRVKCISESIQPRKRMICIDFLYKCGPAIDWSTIFIQRMHLFSRNWFIVKGTEQIIKRDGILMIYLTIEEKEVEEHSEFIKKTRKEREVEITEENTYIVDDADFDLNLKGLLKHENEELKAESDKTQLLSDYVDFAIIWKIDDNENQTQGMHSVTSVFVKSISAFSKNEKKNPYMGKIEIETEEKVTHNFIENPYCQHKVKVNLDLSNLNPEVQRVSLRALEPYELQGDDGNVYVNMDSNEKLFNWLGTNEVIMSRPFKEQHEVEFECVFPSFGVFDVNRFFLKDLDNCKEIK